MAKSGSAMSVAAIVRLEADMDRLLRMMEEANAGMCSTLKTLASTTRSSTPSSPPTSLASSTPTATTTVASQSSTPTSTGAPTPTTTTTLGAIDEYAVTASACCNHATAAPTAVTTAPTFIDSDARLDVSQKLVILLPRVCFNSDDPECSDNDLAPPHRATVNRLHLVCPDGVLEALRWFVSDFGVTFVGADSTHDNHIQEQHVKMVVPVEEDGVSSTLPNRCLMNCLTIIQRCFSFPFNCSLDALLCWQHRPWPPPSKLQRVSCEAELRLLPWPSFDIVERFAVMSLSVHLWKPPWYVSTQQHTSRELPELVELWKCLIRLEKIVVVLVLLGIRLLHSEVTTASIPSKLKLVHYGSYSDSGVSSVHLLVHPTIAYQPWHPYPIVIGWNCGAHKTYLETMLMSDGLVILLGVSMVVQSEASTKKSMHYKQQH
ncbi:hypothetical protein BDA96_04G228800 [Sorghum bicolor]|uniref:Uncharacterized protein n=1 Tax=Sorghum bicolor TaxID=4558 RepID=A0A921R5X3_SORBI|nr:hypothetical protein BDA96_04G228800 [Sorghum bicolor]